MSIYKKEYDTLLTDEKRRRERNIRLLAKLENIEKKAAFLQAKTDRIKSLKRIYKSHYGNSDVPMYSDSHISIKKRGNLYDEIYEDRKPNINSCYITKNITLEEAIEELSKRFVLIPRTVNNKGFNFHEAEIKKSSPEMNDGSYLNRSEENSDMSELGEKEIPSSITLVKEIEKIVNPELREDEKVDVAPYSESIEHKNPEISEDKIETLNETLNPPIISSEENKETYNEAFVTSDTSEENSMKTNLKLMHLSTEIAHVDAMGIDNSHDNVMHLQQHDTESMISNEIQQNQSEIPDNNIDKDDYNEKQINNVVEANENQYIGNKINQESVCTEDVQNTNAEYQNDPYMNTDENYLQPNQQNYDHIQEAAYEQQQYYENNAEGNQYYNESSANQLNTENINYNKSVQELENVVQDQQYYEQPQYTDGQLQYTDEQPQYTDEQPQYTDEQFQYTDEQPQYTDEQPQYTDEQAQQYYEQAGNQSYDNTVNYDPATVENNETYQNYTEQSQYQETLNSESSYDQQQSVVGENYEYTNPELNNEASYEQQTVNENYDHTDNTYDENNVQEYQNYEGQNMNEQYNSNYENHEDSQQYDTTIGEDSQSNVEPQEPYQTEPVKPLQIFESDTEQASVKEDTSVQESDFDFSAQ